MLCLLIFLKRVFWHCVKAFDENLGARCPIPNPYFSAVLLLVGDRVLAYVGDWSDLAGQFC